MQGDNEKVQELMQRIDKGPRLAHVVKLEKRELAAKDGEGKFLVMRTTESAFHSNA